MSLSLKEALKNAGIHQSVKKTVYTREEVLARMDELDAETAKTRNLHNILEALDDTIVAVRAYVRNEKDETNKATILIDLENKAKKVYSVLVKVLQAFVKSKGEDHDVMFMRFGDYVAYGSVCTVTGLPKFDIKKNLPNKKTRVFIVTLRDIKQELSSNLIEEVYLKSTRTDEELYAKLDVVPEVQETPEEPVAVPADEPVVDTPEVAEETVSTPEATETTNNEE